VKKVSDLSAFRLSKDEVMRRTVQIFLRYSFKEVMISSVWLKVKRLNSTNRKEILLMSSFLVVLLFVESSMGCFP
jgi:hypothetical protein